MNKMSNATSPRMAGAIFLLIAVVGLITNFSVKNVFYSADYLKLLSAQTTTIKLAVLADIACGALTIWASILLLPIFLSHSKRLAYGFLGFRLTGYTLAIGEGIFALSMLSLSQQFSKASAPETAYLQAIGSSLQAIHEWTHLLRIFLSFLPFLFFFILTYRFNLLPSFISVWGLLAIPVLMTRMLMSIFDVPTSNYLLAPFALNQLFLGGWLLAKGFREPSPENTKKLSENP